MKILILYTILYLCAVNHARFAHNGNYIDANNRLDVDDNEQTSVRYQRSTKNNRYKTQQKYKGIPIFGANVIIEIDNTSSQNTERAVFGKWHHKTDIDKQIEDVDPKKSSEDAMKIAMNILNLKLSDLYGNNMTELHIYHDEFEYHLTWIIRFSYKNKQNGYIYQHMAIINANNGNIIESFDDTKQFDACGSGGNLKVGKTEYCGESALKINDVKKLFLANHYVQVYNSNNNDHSHTKEAKLISCTEARDRSHCVVDDKGVNGAFGAACDAFQFVNVAFQMYLDWMQQLPINTTLLPLKVYVHVGSNSTEHIYNDLNAELILGDGNAVRYPLSVLDIIAHGMCKKNIYNL